MLSTEEQGTLDSYNNIAKDWVGQNSSPDFWAAEYQKFQLLLPEGLILDVGCGGGRDSDWFIQNGYKYVGVDASEEMIGLAKSQHPNGEFFLQNFYDLQFPENTFDGFWAAASLLHVPKEKIDLPLAEIRRVCKPGAVGFIGIKEGEGVSMVEWQDSGNARYFAYYSREEFKTILEAQGFEVLTVDNKTSFTDSQANFLVFYVRKI